MPGYWVEVRGLARQKVHVIAESKNEAREKAARREFDDAADYPDFEDVIWPTRYPVEEDESL